MTKDPDLVLTFLTTAFEQSSHFPLYVQGYAEYIINQQTGFISFGQYYSDHIGYSSIFSVRARYYGNMISFSSVYAMTLTNDFDRIAHIMKKAVLDIQNGFQGEEKL